MITQQLGRVSVEVPETVVGLAWLPVAFQDVGVGGLWRVGTDGRSQTGFPNGVAMSYDERSIDRAFVCLEEEGSKRRVELCGFPACVWWDVTAQVRIDVGSRAGMSAVLSVQWLVGRVFDPAVVPLFGGMLSSALIDGEPLFSCSRAEIEGVLAGVFDELMPAVPAKPIPPRPDPGPWVEVDEADLERAVFIKIELPLEEDFMDDVPTGLPLVVTTPDAFWEAAIQWVVTVRLDDGQIQDWPLSFGPVDFSLKVTMGGRYTLLDEHLEPVIAPREWYVPHGVVPGRWGDYVDIKLDGAGRFTNWPDQVDLTEFAEEC